MSSEKQTGVVKWFDAKKGYGFITPNASGERDVFVHISDIEKAGLDTLTEGVKVEFGMGEGKKGPKAIDIRALS